MKNDRREFLRKLGVATGAGIISGSPIASFAQEDTFPHNTPQQEELIQRVTILQTTDVHCQILPHDELFWENEKAVFRKTGGYPCITSLLHELKQKNPNTFIIDTGDMFQGSELSVKTTGKAIVPILNAMPYDLYLPGNWEVVYGKKNMQTLMGALDAPKICTNMYHDLGNGKRGELIFKPYQIWNIAGAKIGFLGYTDPLVPLRQSPAYSKGIMYARPEENLQHYVDVLRNKENCGFVIIIAHLGLSQQIALANMPACEGVNYILGGDTHERVRKPILCKYAKVVEPGAFGSFIGKLDLSIENGKVIAEDYELLEVTSSEIKDDEKVSKILVQNEAAFKKDIETIVGYSTVPLYRYFVVENTIDTLILDALNWKFPAIDIVLSNGFRFCPPRVTSDKTGNIPITNGFIFDMLPVDSNLRTAKATGRQIYDWMEKELNSVFSKDASQRFGGWLVKFKGLEVHFNAFDKMNNRIKNIKIKGESVIESKLYTILACEREGDPENVLCRMDNVGDAENTKYTLHATMIEYLKANSPVTPLPEKNAVIMDAPETLLTQVSGVDYEFR